MRYLLLLLVAAVLVPTASAQWTYVSDFPADASILTPHNHGLAVDPDGKVWVMAYYPFTGDSVQVPKSVVDSSSTNNCNKRTNNCRTTALYVLNPDASQPDFSPLVTVTLPGGEADTLGGGTIIDGSGDPVWDWNSGRGIRTGPDGNIYAVYFDTVYKINYKTGAVMDVLEPTILNGSLTAPSLDAAGNLFITGVSPGDPVAYYDSNLDYLGNVSGTSLGFNRTLLALSDGDNEAATTLILPNYSSDIATVYQRETEFADWDSTGIAFEGLSVESITVHPTTGNIWASAGSPNDPPAAPYQPHTWYEFTRADVLANAKPTPLDSIKWNNPGDGRPRAIAFTPDGNTAYVGEFNLSANAVQKFVKGTVAVVPGPQAEGITLHQNEPNPFRGSTTIRFELDAPTTVRLRVFDTLGRTVAVLADGLLTAGPHAERFDGSGLATGVYTFVLEANGRTLTGRMALTR